MKKYLLLLLLIFTHLFCTAQTNQNRLDSIKQQLTKLAITDTGLTEQVKTEINVNNITLSNFLLAVSEIHTVNINVSPDLKQITIANNFNNVSVSDLLLFLCKEYNLTIDFTGNILSIKRFEKPVEKPVERIAKVDYNTSNNSISIDAKNHKLYDVFKQIMDTSGKKLIFSPDIENKNLTAYIQGTSFEKAMENLAFSNNLLVEKTKDNFFIFENAEPSQEGNSDQKFNNRTSRKRRNSNGNFSYDVLDIDKKLLKVNFENTPITTIIYDISKALNLDVFTASPIGNAGMATFNSKAITFDDLLIKLFEAQSSTKKASNQSNSNTTTSSNSVYTFKKDGNVYLFGTEDQISVRSIEVIPLQHRSIELLSGTSGNTNGISSMGNSNNYNNYTTNNNQNRNTSNQNTTYNNTNTISRPSIRTTVSGNFNSYNNKAEALINILPDEIKGDLEIKIDNELNSFYVNGPSAKVERFKKFIKKIDKPVPVVLIEVMLIEVSRNATIETGVSWGIGEKATTTKGGVYPETNLTLGAKTVNKVIGGFDGFGSLNLGKVVPNFFASIKAMESNGQLKIRSTPKLSTLNGHRATFSNGQTSYYAITQRNIYGTDNPQTSEITNYAPIEAQLGLSIKPLVSGDGQVTLDIFVVQSSFGNRIAKNAPPDINSRQFSSVIRVQDQDIVVLGGLEERSRGNSGTGVPLLSKIPIIKWLFSKRKREARKAKLTVLIKPTVIY